jgi:hypothetical protein
MNSRKAYWVVDIIGITPYQTLCVTDLVLIRTLILLNKMLCRYVDNKMS